jgi:hypothetical protein
MLFRHPLSLATRIRTHRYRFYEVSIGTTTAVIDVLSENWNVKVTVGARLRT